MEDFETLDLTNTEYPLPQIGTSHGGFENFGSDLTRIHPLPLNIGTSYTGLCAVDNYFTT